MTLVLDALVQALVSAATYNPDIEVEPAAILWPDKDRQWEPVIARLQGEIPHLFVLGDYLPDNRSGPAIWLRCVIADRIEGLSLAGKVPILYLPGVSRQEIRAVESCQELLKPLAELQYRGVIWSQVNAKDWTVLAFLKSDQGGLGLDVAQDRPSLQAMQLALYRLLDVEVGLLQGKHLDKDYFNTLLIDGDPVRDLLQWMDQGETFVAARGNTEWKAFVEVIKSQLAFDPSKQGVLSAAERLAAHEGPWQPVWDRYCEAPRRYPHLPDQIKKTNMPDDMFADKSGWPQWNEQQEDELRRSLLSLEKLAPHDARSKVQQWDKEHGERRTLVWAELGLAPLAQAMKWLAKLAQVTQTPIAGGSIADLAEQYQTLGWQADDAIIQALKSVDGQDNLQAITVAIRSLYSDWAQESARYLQTRVQADGYPGKRNHAKAKHGYKQGECVFFIDGLRLDVGKRFAARLESIGYQVQFASNWAALPSVTATGKPAVSPVNNKIVGQVGSEGFEPSVAETGQGLSSHHFNKLLDAADWQKLDKTDAGNSSGQSWCEYGDIDSEGHNRGWKLAKHIDSILAEVEDRIGQLFAEGWSQIRLVTDHGWLLLPGTLPKTDLPAALAETKWGRCAVLKSGAHSDEQLYPWYWNEEQHFALANGISCYKRGEEYTHGGLSLQECLTPTIIITQETTGKIPVSADITDIAWRGLRCNVAVDGTYLGLLLDVRKQAGDSGSSLVMNVKPIKETGVGSVVIEDEGLDGSEAMIVLIDEQGELIAQQATRIGGG